MDDFKYPYIHWDSWSSQITNPKDTNNLFIEGILDNYLYQHVSKPTRVQGTENPNALELVFTNEEGIVSDLECQSPLGKSDHCELSFVFKC